MVVTRVTERSKQVPTEAVLEPIETVPPVDEPVAEKPEIAEAAEFITRQVLEKGAAFFDG